MSRGLISRHTRTLLAAVIVSLGAVGARAQSDAEILSSTGDRACEFYFSQGSLKTEAMSQKTIERRFQVGCAVGLGGGTIVDSKEFGAPSDWVIDKVDQLAPANQPAGRCDGNPPTLGSHRFDAVANKVTLSTSCNHRLVGGSGVGNYCAKCYQIKVVLKKKS